MISLLSSCRRSGTCLVLGLVTVSLAQAQPSGGGGIDGGSAVAAVVKMPKPRYAPKSLVVSRMRDTVPQYQALPDLADKAFSLAQPDGQYGLYLWKDEASARAFFSCVFQRSWTLGSD